MCVILLYHRIILQERNIKSVLLQKPWASINKLAQLLHSNIYLSAAKWCQEMYSFSKLSKSLSVKTVLCEDKSSFLCRFFANLPLLCSIICKSRREYWQVVIVIHLSQCNSYNYRCCFSNACAVTFKVHASTRHIPVLGVRQTFMQDKNVTSISSMGVHLQIQSKHIQHTHEYTGITYWKHNVNNYVNFWAHTFQLSKQNQPTQQTWMGV